jgi:lipoprotein-releasing system permease protein
MTEFAQTPAFAPFEWLLSFRYLKARRREGFISVLAGFSFLESCMNGFRKELLGKMLGINGHMLVQAFDSPLTDWKDVADRISQVNGVSLVAPIVDGMALLSSPSNAAGIMVRGIRGQDLTNLASIAGNIKQGTLGGLMTVRGW